MNDRTNGHSEIGRVIGLYTLIDHIGEGGMGEVYAAEQTEPIRRKVALKIIKLGMDTERVHRPLRVRAPGPGPDGPPLHRQGLRRRRHRPRPPLLRHGVRGGRSHHRVLRRASSWASASAWSCSSRSARASSTPTRRPSSTATQTVQRPGHRAGRRSLCPRSSTSAWPRRSAQHLTEQTLFTQHGPDHRHARST